MTDILEIHAVTEYYRCAFRPNDPELTVSEVLDFIEYMNKFYVGEEAIYRYDFTISEICQGMIDRFNYRPSLDFDGDSVDREYVRDMIIDARERASIARQEAV